MYGLSNQRYLKKNLKGAHESSLVTFLCLILTSLFVFISFYDLSLMVQSGVGKYCVFGYK